MEVATMQGLAAAAAVLALAGVTALGGCSGTTPEPSATQPSGQSSPTSIEMKAPMAKDLVYQTGSTERTKPVLDVWTLPEGEGRPVVVMFHGGLDGGVNKRYLDPLARRVALQGAVVFVPNLWATVGENAGEALAAARTWRDGAACAVAYAVAHANEYGGDANTLVIFGHSSGGTIAETVATRGKHDASGCAVDPTTFDVDGLVAWDSDPLLAGDSGPDENWPDGLPDVLAEATAWRWLATSKRFNVDLVNGEQAAKDMVRPVPDETGDWLARRDPTGAFRQQLQTLGALDDSALGIREESDLLEAQMTNLSYDVRRVTLPHAGHEWQQTSNEARDLLVQSILTVATR
jgi:dienelactone hydrolase